MPDILEFELYNWSPTLNLQMKLEKVKEKVFKNQILSFLSLDHILEPFLIRFFWFICGVEDSSWKHLDTPHPTRTPIYLINTSAKWSLSKVALGNPQMFNLCN